MQKACIRCDAVKDAGEFYRHHAMADGYLNKCKSCCKAEAAANRAAKLGHYRDYDRRRTATETRKQSVAERQRRYRKANPSKQIARAAVARAIRLGVLVRQPCEECGCDLAEAHHEDYSKPLDVRWLCRRHHLIRHGNYLETAT